MATNRQKLDDIQAKIVADKVCPELAATATQLVFGDGNPEAELVLVGEAPGKNEDLQGKPFVGAAGQFLNTMLDMIGWKRQDIYITNIVKYRPPNNREPEPEEKKAFLPYLQAQLEVIRPKVLATLGSHSLSCFLPDVKISQCHGQPMRIHLNFRTDAESKKGKSQTNQSFPLVIMPLFHPAAALYNGGMRQTLIDDFAKLPKVLAQITK
jgi:uracil-DNA glycosylase